MIKKGKWSVPGYRVSSKGTRQDSGSCGTFSPYRRSSESSLSCKRAQKYARDRFQGRLRAVACHQKRQAIVPFELETVEDEKR